MASMVQKIKTNDKKTSSKKSFLNKYSKPLVKIVGSYTSQFGELWDMSLGDLIKEVVEGVMEDVVKSSKFGNENIFDPKEIEAIYISNMASGLFDNQLHLNAMVSQLFEHFPPSMRIEGACASGSLALIAAQDALNSGKYKTVMVVGVEKMTDFNSQQTAKVLAAAADYDFEYGSIFPALYAILAKAYMYKYGLTREQLSSVAVKNHLHALKNSKAHFRKSFSLEQVSNSSMVATPLRLLDCSPVSDGASAVILSAKNSGKMLNKISIKSNNKLANNSSNNSVKISVGEISYKNKPKIIGVGHAQDTLDLARRKSLTSLSATKKAVKLAFLMANKTNNKKLIPANIDVAEIHDCFTIAEILAIEDLGFFKKGTGGKVTFGGKTTFGGKIIINPSGGLKACGHPIGATGVKQVAYLAKLLENGIKISKKNKLNDVNNFKINDDLNGFKKPNNLTKDQQYQYALAHNVGGSGATAVVHILER